MLCAMHLTHGRPWGALGNMHLPPGTGAACIRFQLRRPLTASPKPPHTPLGLCYISTCHQHAMLPVSHPLEALGCTQPHAPACWHTCSLHTIPAAPTPHSQP